MLSLFSAITIMKHCLHVSLKQYLDSIKMLRVIYMTTVAIRGTPLKSIRPNYNVRVKDIKLSFVTITIKLKGRLRKWTTGKCYSSKKPNFLPFCVRIFLCHFRWVFLGSLYGQIHKDVHSVSTWLLSRPTTEFNV